jgi:hypothetical protein
MFYAKASRYTLWLTKEGLVFDSTRKKENPEIVPVKESKLKVNYFIGNDKAGWHCAVSTAMAVLY